MNAKCFCNHPLAAHRVGGGCGACKCDGFTEKVCYRCDVCEEPISILTAPNEEVERVRFKDDGRNYAHRACRRKQAAENATKPKPFQRPTAVRVMGVDMHWKVVGGAVVIPVEAATLILQVMFRAGVLSQDGEVDSDLVQGEDERQAVDNLVKMLE